MISSARSSFIAAFAEELRRAREYSGVSLDDVATVTHVSSEFLAALEDGHWESIPQPYLRGYLQLYAQASGMNVDKVLQSFDKIISAAENEDSATLDYSSPLLRQPEHIGVTRAKIRTGWFTALTRNRKAAYLALAAAVAVLVTGLYLSRRAQRPHISLSPFESTVSEYRQTLRGPVTYLDVFTSDSSAHPSKRDTNRLVIMGLDSGFVLIATVDQLRRIVRYGPYDTLVITYDSLAYIAITPALSAQASGMKADTMRPESVNLDTAFYLLSESERPSHVVPVEQLRDK